MSACGIHGAHAHRVYFLGSPAIKMILNSAVCQRQFKALISSLDNHLLLVQNITKLKTENTLQSNELQCSFNKTTFK